MLGAYGYHTIAPLHGRKTSFNGYAFSAGLGCLAGIAVGFGAGLYPLPWAYGAGGVSLTTAAVGAAGTGLATASQGVSLWPSPAYGPQVINGITYSGHALERMAPLGLIHQGKILFSRGIPPSVVQNAIQYGTSAVGNEPGTIVHTFENIMVVTNAAATKVITVYPIGR